MAQLHQSAYTRPILVFLPRPSGEFVVSKLIAAGRTAVCVTTAPELSNALDEGVWAVAITTRPDIDVILGSCALPVINIEIFFHQTIDENGRVTDRNVFDSRAFMERVQLLAEPRPAQRSAIAGGEKPNQEAVPRRKQSGWIATLQNLVGKGPATSWR